ncbi:TPA: DUF945 domain-containing protein, partial [Klebsiella pneumoniae]|nr:DUF945 domain-containing protein [Klebsiella pneumoniae]
MLLREHGLFVFNSLSDKELAMRLASRFGRINQIRRDR